MADYYFPIKVTVDVVDGEISDALYNDWDSEVVIAVGTGTTSTAATNALTGGTSVSYLCGSIFQPTNFWIKTSTSTVYAAIGLIRPYCQYSRTTAKKLNVQTNATLPTVVTFDAELAQSSGEYSLDRYLPEGIFINYDTYVNSRVNAKYFYQNGTCSLMDGSTTYNKYVNALDYEGHSSIYLLDPDDGSQYFVNHGSDALVPAKALYFDFNCHSSDISFRNPFIASLYWSGTSITVYNQSVSSGLSISTFDVTATTTANTTVSIFHLASSQSVPAGTYKSVTVTHAASNPVADTTSVTLTLGCAGPAWWNGPISVKDSKNLFNETSTSSRTLTATKSITANTSGGTVSVYMRPPTRTITASTGINLRATNTTSMNIVLMYLEIWAEDVTNGSGYQEIMSVTSNPTIPAGASNIVLGKLISKTSYSGQHLKITLEGYTTYAPNSVTFQASGSTGQNFGVHTISGIDPANFDEEIEWDAGGNVVLTGGTIMFKFS